VLPGQEPGESELATAIEKLVPHYPKTPVPTVIKMIIKEDWAGVVLLIQDLMPTLKKDASSGFPLMRLQPNKGPLIEKEQSLVISAVVDRLKLYVSFGGKLPETALELFQAKLVDPVRLFVKGEPHHKRKIGVAERLISSVSVIDEIIARLLFTNQDSAEIAHWTVCPSRPGMGFDDVGIKKFSAWIDSRYAAGRTLASSDVKAWDFSFKGWMFSADVKMRTALLTGATEKESALFTLMATTHHHCLGRSLYVLSDGSVYEQMFFGKMESGSKATTPVNSRARALLCVLCGSHPLCVASMGDDCIEEATSNPTRYEELGFKLKMFEPSRDGRKLEFCCHEFSRGGLSEVERINIEKSLFRMLHEPFTQDLLDQFKYEFRHSSDLGSALELISRAGWTAAKNGEAKDCGNHGHPQAQAW
jgi:hypothetical protein